MLDSNNQERKRGAGGAESLSKSLLRAAAALLVICLIAFSLPSDVWAEGSSQAANDLREKAASPQRDSRSAMPFARNELFRYQVYWLGMAVGWAELGVKYEDDEKGKPIIHFRSRARSTGVFSLIFHVDDQIDSYYDLETLRPISYRIKQEEGDHKANKRIDFYHSLGKAAYFSNQDKPIIYDLKPGAQDSLSALYYVRMQDVEVGKPIMVTSFVRPKNAEIKVDVLKKEVLQTKLGPVEAHLLVPSSEYEGIFKKSGPIYTWLSADDLKVPLRMESKIVVGAITVVLEEVDGETAKTFPSKK